MLQQTQVERVIDYYATPAGMQSLRGAASRTAARPQRKSRG